MKRVMIKINVSVLLLVLASCSTNYRMTTCVYKDGRISREVYAKADSAFLAGNRSGNPFLFQLGDRWMVENLDSCLKVDFFGEEAELNVKAERTWKAEGTFSFFSANEKWMKPLAEPQEKLEKHFRWFYTYYTYTCDFREIEDKGPIPMDKYLGKPEQALLFQGDMSGYQGMNGVELKSVLEDAEEKFMKWLYHTQFELSYEVVEYFLQRGGEAAYAAKLKTEKEEIFLGDKNRKEENECSPEYVCTLLDKRYDTLVFTDLYKANQKEMQKRYDEKCVTMELFDNQIKFELAMPGELLSANTLLKEEGRVIWKVDAYRLLGGNYVLEAESRVMNMWAFCVTGFLIALAGYGILRKKENGKREKDMNRSRGTKERNKSNR